MSMLIDAEIVSRDRDASGRPVVGCAIDHDFDERHRLRGAARPVTRVLNVRIVLERCSPSPVDVP